MADILGPTINFFTWGKPVGLVRFLPLWHD